MCRWCEYIYGSGVRIHVWLCKQVSIVGERRQRGATAWACEYERNRMVQYMQYCFIQVPRLAPPLFVVNEIDA